MSFIRFDKTTLHNIFGALTKKLQKKKKNISDERKKNVDKKKIIIH